jgi:hypothetical protein
MNDSGTIEARDLPRIVRDTIMLMAGQVEAATREMNRNNPDFEVSSTIEVRVGDITIRAGWQWNHADDAIPAPLGE